MAGVLQLSFVKLKNISEALQLQRYHARVRSGMVVALGRPDWAAANSMCLDTPLAAVCPLGQQLAKQSGVSGVAISLAQADPG